VWEASHVVAERLVELLDPAHESTVLELAAGPGDTGFLAARRLGPGGRLISSDFAPEMVEAARRRAAELEVTNVEFRVIDGQAIGLEDASVDGVLCRWGYMLMPEPAAGLAETRRVLRAKARVAFAVWGSADENRWGSTVGRVLVESGLLERPEPDTPGPFRLQDPERLRSLVEEAGLDLVSLEDVEVTWRYASFDEYWESTRDVSRMLSSVLARLDAAEEAVVRAGVEAELAAYAGDDGLAIPGVCRVVLAARPA